ncbi:MAG: hypothetical protein VW362_06140 [Candidatus Nanopelagicales bacterium]
MTTTTDTGIIVRHYRDENAFVRQLDRERYAKAEEHATILVAYLEWRDRIVARHGALNARTGSAEWRALSPGRTRASDVAGYTHDVATETYNAR